MVYQHVQDAPVPPSQLPEGGSIPQELDGLVMRSLAKDPDDRFQSAEEMRGLVQYALQMLHDQGSNTGTWNTGPVSMALPHGRGGAATTAMPVGGGSGGQPQYTSNASTSQFQQPMVPALNPDDGSAFPGGGHGGPGGHGGYEGYDDRGGSGSRWKMWLFAVLAIVAIAGGVAYAVNNVGTKGDQKTPGTTQSSPVGQPSASTTPDAPATHQSTENQPTFSDNSPTPNRTRTQSYSPTASPSASASTSASPSASASKSASPSASSSKPQTLPPTKPPETGDNNNPEG